MIDWAHIQLVDAYSSGVTPVEDCLRWLDDHPEVEQRSVLPRRDCLLAMLGRFEEARTLQLDAARRIEELGVERAARTHLALRRFEVAVLENDVARAEDAARESCELVEAAGELGNVMWFCSNRAHALLALGEDEQAEYWLERGHALAPSPERYPQMLLRQARAKVLTRRGEPHEAERLAREAVALGAETDMLNAHAAALVDLAEVLVRADRDARPELEEALALYERKGNLVMAERTRSHLA